jgi:outer membrane lipoprotein-sorting protein
VVIVQGRAAGNTRIKLYFDQETGLLVRTLRYNDTVVGQVPTETDYSNYKDVAGVKLPFSMVITWTDGQSKIELKDIQVNVPVEASRFAMPAPAVLKPSGAAAKK